MEVEVLVHVPSQPNVNDNYMHNKIISVGFQNKMNNLLYFTTIISSYREQQQPTTAHHNQSLVFQKPVYILSKVDQPFPRYPPVFVNKLKINFKRRLPL